ncbi:MAG: flagellar basal body rod protein FlgB [Gammaproteobacteria bacterium]
MTDSIFGLSEKAMQVCEDRAVLLTNNLVNSSTPHFKARDLDFNKILKESMPNQDLKTNQSGQITSKSAAIEHALYRVPMQESSDGNTVDENIERKNFLENAMKYQVNLRFVEYKSDELRAAIKGE